MNKLNIKSYEVKGKTTNEILAIVSKFPFYLADKEANKKKRKRWGLIPEKLTGEALSKIFINDDIIVGYKFSEDVSADLHLHYIERELQFVDVYEFPLLKAHKVIPFMEKIINKEPLHFHWKNTNALHQKFAHPFFKNVLGLKNTDFMIRPNQVGLNFPYEHPEFKAVKQDVLLIQNLYFKNNHLIAYKVFNVLEYESKIVWSSEFYGYLSQLEPIC